MVNNNLIKFYDENLDKLEIGVDEVGRGPMFGRVYSAAVILPNNSTFQYNLLKDSKKFTSKKKILEVANYIKSNSLFWSISYSSEKSIDINNIKNATYLAMHTAIKNVIEYSNNNNNNNNNNIQDKYYLLIDGNDFKPYTYLNKDKEILEELSHILVEKGDNKYCSIAAASILAKVERDNYINEICKCYTKLNIYYDLENNKGYGTTKHMEGIKNIGISPWHRKTFGCCKNAKLNTEKFYL